MIRASTFFAIVGAYLIGAGTVLAVAVTKDLGIFVVAGLMVTSVSILVQANSDY